jgi:hypothetical protein
MIDSNKGLTGDDFRMMMEEMGAKFIDLDALVPPDPNEMRQAVWMLSRWAHDHRYTYESLGFIPQFLHTDDARPAKVQIDENYAHGGGWRDSPGPWRIRDEMLHSDDAKYHLVATAHLHGDEVQLFESGWTAIIHADGSYEVARLD